jgi:recombination protein RecR
MRPAREAPLLERLIGLIARLPGLGPRSARRAALFLLKRRDTLMRPLAAALMEAADQIKTCSVCGNLDLSDPCGVCTDERRDAATLCVVAEVQDLWALERTGAFSGRYHVLGGVLSALDGVRPQDLRFGALEERLKAGGISELILALPATVDGQATAHVAADLAAAYPVSVTRLAHGVPIGGELDTLDDGTILAALRSRRGA